MKNMKNNKLLHYNNIEDILIYLHEHPEWISGFANGEGSFTASFNIDIRATWGLFPQCEFNITQLMNDSILLNAINKYFDNGGGVYSRKNKVGTLSFRKISVLNDKIIPFLIKIHY